MSKIKLSKESKELVEGVKEIDRFVRRERVLVLRAEGLSLVEIGEELGISATQVRNDFDRAVEDSLDDSATARRNRIVLADRRLEMLWRKTVLALENGDYSVLNNAIKIIDCNKALHGLNAPSTSAIDVGFTPAVINLGGGGPNSYLEKYALKLPEEKLNEPTQDVTR